MAPGRVDAGLKEKEKESLSLEHAVSDLITAAVGCTPYEPYETMKFFILQTYRQTYRQTDKLNISEI